MHRLLFFICLALLPLNSYANERFDQYLKSQYIKNIKKVHAMTMDQANFAVPCNEPYKITSGEVKIIDEIIFRTNDEHPTAGSWMHRYYIDRCEQKQKYNFILTARVDKRPKYEPFAMGETLVDTKLFEKVVEEVLESVDASKACPRKTYNVFARLVDTEVIDAPQSNYESWEEIWTIYACHDHFPVRVKFTPDSRDGSDFYIIKKTN